MITIDLDPVLLQLGPLSLRWYGLMYVVGIAVGLFVAIPYAKEKGLIEEDIWSVFWPAAVAGLIGARLYYVLQQPLDPFLAEPWRILAMWEGGMAFYGAVFAVVATLIVMCRWKGIAFWKLADAVAIFAVVGQGFGRIGNLINGDIVGYPTTLPWGVVYAHPHSFVVDHTVAYLPAAAFELLFNLFFFLVLWSLRHTFTRPGLLFVVYLAGYAIGQFVLFFWRANEIVALGLRQAQLTSIVVLVVAAALGWWIIRYKPQTSREETTPD